MRLLPLPRFVYRAPLCAVGAPLVGEMAELALAVAQTASAARANYARRAAFRATPHGLWAGVGIGELGERTRARTGPMRASITVAYEPLWRFARAQLDDPATRERTRLRVAPSLMRDETSALWLAFGDDVEAVQRAAEVDELLGRVLDAAREWIAWPALREVAGVDDELLLLLVADGVLLDDGTPPLVGPPPLAWMAARHAHWAEVATLLATPTVAAIDGLDEALHAVLVHEGRVTLSRTAVERAAALAPLLFRLQEALAPPLAERMLDAGTHAALRATEEIFGAGAFDFDALALGGYGTPLDATIVDGVADAVPPPASAAVVRAIVDAILTAVRAGRSEVALDGALLDGLAPSVATPPSFELMLTPMRERRGAAPGDGWLVGLHAPAGASWGRFAHAVGTPLVDALAPLAALPDTVDVDYAPSPRLGDLTAHPPLRAATLALSSWPASEAADAAAPDAEAPDARTIVPADLALALDGARGEPALQAGGAPLVPSPLWRVRSTTAPRGAFRLLTAQTLTRQHAPWALHLGGLGDLTYVPRLVLDGFVVAPASWRIPPIADRAALRRWRRALAVPDTIQIGHEDELMRVDLEARDAVETLRRLDDERRPRAYEIWPPLDAGIDRGGRRLEAIVAVVDDDAAPTPAPQARVPPPAKAGGALDWRTWKLFGAADRADRVLGGALAPAIAEALGAGEIAAWFFLRYIDGPGRRDHLRLRVRVLGDEARFAARLAVALAPARAAGDVVAVERAEYHREQARYGADAIDAVERVFESDSALVLALLEDDADPLELLVASYDALAAGAGLDPPERHALARRRREAYGVGRDAALADAYRARQPTLRARLGAPAAPFIEHGTRVAAALAPLSHERRASLLPPLLHLAAVRLVGADATREAAAFYLWERTRESLARHRER